MIKIKDFSEYIFLPNIDDFIEIKKKINSDVTNLDESIIIKKFKADKIYCSFIDYDDFIADIYNSYQNNDELVKKQAILDIPRGDIKYHGKNIYTIEEIENLFKDGCKIIILFCTQAVMSIPLKIFKKYYGLEIAECDKDKKYKTLSLKIRSCPGNDVITIKKNLRLFSIDHIDISLYYIVSELIIDIKSKIIVLRWYETKKLQNIINKFK